jgi:hypothetical protein
VGKDSKRERVNKKAKDDTSEESSFISYVIEINVYKKLKS